MAQAYKFAALSRRATSSGQARLVDVGDEDMVMGIPGISGISTVHSDLRCRAVDDAPVCCEDVVNKLEPDLDSW